MLGVFDSGYGGLTVLRAIHERLPRLSTFYLGDNARAPYGARNQEEIFRCTLEGVERLFAEGCPLVIVACNTSSAEALRRIQQEVLPLRFPGRRVLGIVRPYAEATVVATRTGHVGVLGTEATVRSGAYERELTHLRPDIRVTALAAPTLAALVEAGEEMSPEAQEEIRRVLTELRGRDQSMDVVLLACTHFPLAMKLFDLHRPDGVRFLDQASVVAAKLADYLTRHPAIDLLLEKEEARRYATTADARLVTERATRFYGQSVLFERATHYERRTTHLSQ